MADISKIGVNGSEYDIKDKVARDQIADLNPLKPAATASDVGKTLIAKTVEDGKVTEYEFGEAGAVKSVNNKTGDVVLNARDVSAEGIGYAYASGNPCVIYDGIEGDNADDIVVTLEPVQDLHGYDHPWVGGATANKWDEEYYSGGYILASGTVIPSGYGNRIVSKNFIPVNSGETYRLVLPYRVNNYGARVAFYDIGRNLIGAVSDVYSETLTAPENAAFMMFNTGDVYGSTYNHDIAVNYPATETNYVPYSNICPITGWDGTEVVRTGKNLLDTSVWYSGLGAYNPTIGDVYTPTVVSTVVDNHDGTFSFPNASWAGNCARAIVKPNTKYYIQDEDFVANNGAVGWHITDENNVILGKAGFYDTKRIFRPAITTPDNACYLYFYFADRSTGDITTNVISEPYVVLGENPAEYEPYSGDSASVTFGQTVYGGQIKVTEGKVVVDKVTALVKDLAKNGGFIVGTTSCAQRYVLSPVSTIVSSTSYKHGAISSMSSEAAAYYGSGNKTSEVATNCFAINTAGTNCFVYDADITLTSEQFDAKYADMQICYPLAEPIELTVTPAQLSLLEGTNILTTDGDNITLKYLGSDASTVQAVLNNTFKAFAPVEEAIAKTNHAVGDYISFNTQFCKVTQAISAGEIIQVGTNVKLTTIAEELQLIFTQLNA